MEAAAVVAPQSQSLHPAHSRSADKVVQRAQRIIRVVLFLLCDVQPVFLSQTSGGRIVVAPFLLLLRRRSDSVIALDPEQRCGLTLTRVSLRLLCAALQIEFGREVHADHFLF